MIKASNPRSFILERTLFNLESYSFFEKAGGINYYLFNLDLSQLSKQQEIKYEDFYLNIYSIKYNHFSQYNLIYHSTNFPEINTLLIMAKFYPKIIKYTV